MSMTLNSEHHDKASVCLKIAVIGGGLAGLAAAYALKSGHDVTIIEKRDGKSESLGVTQSPPNMTKILYRWGLRPILDRIAKKNLSVVFRNGPTGDLIGLMYFDKEFLQDLVADFIYIGTQRLENLLHDMVQNEGVKTLSATITGIDLCANAAALSFSNGESLPSDFAICADGYDSNFRHLVPGEEDVDLESAKKHLAITWALPIEVANLVDEPTVNTEPTQWQLWIGPGYLLHVNLPYGKKTLNMTMTLDYERTLKPDDQLWKNRPLEYWGIDLDRFEPRARKLINLAKFVTSRVFVSRPSLSDLVCENSRFILVGDAAHPILPGSNQHLGATFEDAETLRALFSRIQRHDQIPDFLAAYEDIRQPRAVSLVNYDRNFHLSMKLPAGPERDQMAAMLYEGMAHGSWDHMHEESFRMVWGEEMIQYTYDATEQVDDWWTKWGPMMTREYSSRGEKQCEHARASASTFVPVHRRTSIRQGDP